MEWNKNYICFSITKVPIQKKHTSMIAKQSIHIKYLSGTGKLPISTSAIVLPAFPKQGWPLSQEGLGSISLLLIYFWSPRRLKKQRSLQMCLFFREKLSWEQPLLGKKWIIFLPESLFSFQEKLCKHLYPCGFYQEKHVILPKET